MTPFDKFTSIEGLRETNAIIYECITGSHSYGTSTPQSDIDKKGVFCLPLSLFPSIYGPPNEVTDGTDDYKFFELTKFFRLAGECNPTIIELLWTPQDCVILTSEAWEEIKMHRNMFVSKRALKAFTVYAYAQIKKASGQNKMVMKEWPIEKPKKTDFCWIIPYGNGYRLSGVMETMPGRPIPLSMIQWDLSRFNAASLEHVQDAYRIYYYGDAGKGVFRGDGMLVTESIPVEDEYDKLYGFLIWNRNAYEQALRDHERYWTWRRERNEARWNGQDGEAFKYDRKNMMHCVRLVLSGKNILETGEPIVRFEGETLDYLMGVRTGKYEYNEIMKFVDDSIKSFDDLAKKSSLPEETDMEKIDELCRNVYRIHYRP